MKGYVISIFNCFAMMPETKVEGVFKTIGEAKERLAEIKCEIREEMGEAFREKYSVWVGGGEVDDDYFDNYDEAARLCQKYRDDGYDDACVETLYNEAVFDEDETSVCGYEDGYQFDWQMSAKICEVEI